MYIIKQGKYNTYGNFYFKCKCGAEWVAKRNEVTFTPPCLPYKVYMKCPCCGKTTNEMKIKEGES